MHNLLHADSSVPSEQSEFWSQTHDIGTHSPVEFRHVNSSGEQTWVSAIAAYTQFSPAKYNGKEKNTKNEISTQQFYLYLHTHNKCGCTVSHIWMLAAERNIYGQQQRRWRHGPNDGAKDHFSEWIWIVCMRVVGRNSLRLQIKSLFIQINSNLFAIWKNSFFSLVCSGEFLPSSILRLQMNDVLGGSSWMEQIIRRCRALLYRIISNSFASISVLAWLILHT